MDKKHDKKFEMKCVRPSCGHIETMTAAYNSRMDEGHTLYCCKCGDYVIVRKEGFIENELTDW